jgi:hypothetical protein
LEGQQIGERFRAYLDVNIADSPSNPYPGGLWAGGSDARRRLTEALVA